MQGNHSRFNRELDRIGGSHVGKYQSAGHKSQYKGAAVAFISCSVNVSHYAVVRSVFPIVLLCMPCPPPPPRHAPFPGPFTCLKPPNPAFFPLPLRPLCLLGRRYCCASGQPYNHKAMSVYSASCYPSNHIAMSLHGTSCQPQLLQRLVITYCLHRVFMCAAFRWRPGCHTGHSQSALMNCGASYAAS